MKALRVDLVHERRAVEKQLSQQACNEEHLVLVESRLDSSSHVVERAQKERLAIHLTGVGFKAATAAAIVFVAVALMLFELVMRI
jgi:hypothetical protein